MRRWVKSVIGIGFIFIMFGMSVSDVAADKLSKPKFVIGNGKAGLKDGGFSQAVFNEPYSAALYKENLYVTDSANHCIRLVDFDKKQVSMYTAGNIQDKSPAALKGYRDSYISMAQFNEPRGISVDKDGVIYIADTGNHVIRKIKNNNVYTYAGTGKAGDKSDKLSNSEFNRPSDVAVLGDFLYVADTLNSAIKKIDKQGNVTTVLQGNKLIEPSGLSSYGDTLYIADSGAQRIFKYKEGEGISTVAGRYTALDSQTGYRKWGLKDGKVKSALFNFPKSVAVDSGSLLVADTWNSRIRKIKSGKVKTLLKFKRFQARPTKILTTKKEMIVVDQANHQILVYKK